MLPTYLRTAPLEEKVLVCQPQNNPQMKRDQIKKELRHPKTNKKGSTEGTWLGVGDGS